MIPQVQRCGFFRQILTAGCMSFFSKPSLGITADRFHSVSFLAQYHGHDKGMNSLGNIRFGRRIPFATNYPSFGSGPLAQFNSWQGCACEPEPNERTTNGCQSPEAKASENVPTTRVCGARGLAYRPANESTQHHHPAPGLHGPCVGIFRHAPKVYL